MHLKDVLQIFWRHYIFAWRNIILNFSLIFFLEIYSLVNLCPFLLPRDSAIIYKPLTFTFIPPIPTNYLILVQFLPFNNAVFITQRPNCI